MTISSASAVNDQFAAGKNKIINGDFGIWQRGTSFANPVNGTFTADRWNNTLTPTPATGTVTFSQQTFTPGTAPVAGYEGTYYLRNQGVSPTSMTYNVLTQKIEDVRTLAGQTVTVSMWLKADSARTVYINVFQNFGSGGSGDVTVVAGGPGFAVTTSWTRFVYTFNMPSITGNTIGAGSNIRFEVVYPINASSTVDLWGVQLEAGSVATAFTTASGSIGGELALCQRYYYRQGGSATYQYFGTAVGVNATTAVGLVIFPVTMRVGPTATDYSNLAMYDTGSNTLYAITSVTSNTYSVSSAAITIATASGLTQFRPYNFAANGSLSGYLGFSAEL